MDFFFPIFAQNIDCGYMLELPWWGGSNEYPQSMFWIKNKKKCLPHLPQFYYIKVRYKGVYISQTCFLYEEAWPVESLDLIGKTGMTVLSKQRCYLAVPTRLSWSLTALRQHAHAIYRDFFRCKKNEIFIRKIMIFLIFLLKALIVGTR